LPLVSFKGKIWLIGGYQQGIGTKGDIWSTTNGKDWKLVTDSASFGAREGHTVAVFQDKL
jgi:leucine-zipper-like transcriptional regulator 1